MDEQEKEIEEILRTFDKAPSPSSKNSVQSHFSAIGAFMTETFERHRSNQNRNTN